MNYKDTIFYPIAKTFMAFSKTRIDNIIRENVVGFVTKNQWKLFGRACRTNFPHIKVFKIPGIFEEKWQQLEGTILFFTSTQEAIGKSIDYKLFILLFSVSCFKDNFRKQYLYLFHFRYNATNIFADLRRCYENFCKMSSTDFEYIVNIKSLIKMIEIVIPYQSA